MARTTHPKENAHRKSLAFEMQVLEFLPENPVLEFLLNMEIIKVGMSSTGPIWKFPWGNDVISYHWVSKLTYLTKHIIIY